MMIVDTVNEDKRFQKDLQYTGKQLGNSVVLICLLFYWKNACLLATSILVLIAVTTIAEPCTL